MQLVPMATVPNWAK